MSLVFWLLVLGVNLWQIDERFSRYCRAIERGYRLTADQVDAAAPDGGER